jgi:hypothetical protein
MRIAARVAAGVLCAASLAACHEERTVVVISCPAPPSPFADRLLRIAASFPALGRVDDGGRMAPTDCMMPSRPRARATASADAATHGGDKVYSMFAKDPASYRALTALHARRARVEPLDVDGTEGCSQVLVKEAYEPVELAPGEMVSRFVGDDPASDEHQPILPAEKDGKRFAAGKRTGLFVMFRLDPTTEGTDDGWVYGTVTADAKTVTSVGRVAACMACHEKAPHGRLFGLPK